MRKQEVKSYHAYMSEESFQDQVFFNVVLDRMMEETNVDKVEKIIIESDNCTSQYKSSEHFAGLQELSNKFNVTLVRIYGVAGHGKGEVDHVGGLANVAIRREISAGQQLSNAEEMINCLEGKFCLIHQ